MANNSTYKGLYAMHKYWGKKSALNWTAIRDYRSPTKTVMKTE